MQEPIILKKVNEVYLQVFAETGTHLELREFCSCYAANYKFNPKYKMKMWNGKIYFYDIRNHLFPIGLLPELFKFADKFNYKIKFDFDVSCLSKSITDELLEEFCEYIFKDTRFDIRDYQHNAIKAAIENKRGILVSATGSGKSLIIYTLFRYLLAKGKKKMMLIVPSTSLVEQMFSDFIDYGWIEINKNVTKLYSGKKPDFNKPILITTWQSIYKLDNDFFRDYESVIIDEAHNTKSNSIKTIMSKCINADYRIGLTGTLPVEKSDDFNIRSSVGPTIFELKSKALIDIGVLSQIYIANIILKYPKSIVDEQSGRKYQEEVKFIESYSGRNNAFQTVFSNIPNTHNTLILCSHLDHLNAIEKHLKSTLDKKFTIYIIHGKIDTDEREDIRQLMEKGQNVILLGTYSTMSTGINIKRIHHVVFASSSKSKIRVLQTIGRGLRTHESKDKVIIWDLIDDLSRVTRTGSVVKNYMIQHWEERQKLFLDQGFISHNLTIEI